MQNDHMIEIPPEIELVVNDTQNGRTSIEEPLVSSQGYSKDWMSIEEPLVSSQRYSKDWMSIEEPFPG